MPNQQKRADFKDGEYVLYQKGGTFQFGKIKRCLARGAFVWYHEGQTAALTPYEYLYHIDNAFVIKQTSLAELA